jgi:predicted MPP superfamily phosphohydrolase
MFRFVVISVFGLIDAYLSWSLRLPLWGILVLSAAFGAILWMPLVFWQSDREETTRAEIFMQWIAFASMGFGSFLWIGTMFRDGVSLFLPTSLHTPETRIWIFAFAIAAFFVGVLNALFRLKIVESEVRIPGLPKAFAGFRIVQITDLHVGPTIRLRQVERVARQMRKARPDVVVFTGDAVDGSVGELSPFLEPLRNIEASYGRFYVPGNHEYYWGAEPWISKFRELGFEPLLNSHATVQKDGATLLIGGVIDPASVQFGGPGPDLKKTLNGAPTDAFPRILLAHQPGIAQKAEEAGFQLQISGHTHGGQFFPWTLVVGWVHQFPHGLRKLKGMWVYVSRGTGFWGPPVRLGAPAEVSLLVLS